MRWWPQRIALIAALAVGVAPGAAHAADPSPALAKIIAAAKKEPKLNLEWGGGILGGAEALKVMADAMNAMYGTSITIRFTPGASLPEVVNQVAVAAAAGQPSPTDAVIGSDQHAADLADRGVRLRGHALHVAELSLLQQREDLRPDLPVLAARLRQEDEALDGDRHAERHDERARIDEQAAILEELDDGAEGIHG